jgi:Uma2 family endonuclease
MTIAEAWPTTSRAFTVNDLACPPGLFIVPAPGVRMWADTELGPDLVVIRQDQLAGRRVTRPPLLTVEIQSPSSALFDLNTKKAVYERFSIASYWVVIPDVDQPELIVFELRDGHYEQVAHVTGSHAFRAERPFSVEVVPARLVADLLPD